MAARAPRETEILTPAQALAFVARHGVVCESARRGTIPSLAGAIAGEAIAGNWWSHAHGQRIFALTRAVREDSYVLVCRLVDGRITFVHARLWPALVRLAQRFPAAALARVCERHTADGRHVVDEVPFPRWVPAATRSAARRLDETRAGRLLRPLLLR